MQKHKVVIMANGSEPLWYNPTTRTVTDSHNVRPLPYVGISLLVVSSFVLIGSGVTVHSNHPRSLSFRRNCKKIVLCDKKNFFSSIFFARGHNFLVCTFFLLLGSICFLVVRLF